MKTYTVEFYRDEDEGDLCSLVLPADKQGLVFDVRPWAPPEQFHAHERFDHESGKITGYWLDIYGHRKQEILAPIIEKLVGEPVHLVYLNTPKEAEFPKGSDQNP